MIKDKNLDPGSSNFWAGVETICLSNGQAQVAAGTSETGLAVWIAPYAGKILSVKGWIKTKTGSNAAQLDVHKGATAAAATTVLSAPMDMTSDAIVTGTLAVTTFAAGDGLFLDVTTGSATTMDYCNAVIAVRPLLGKELSGY